jgi:hypothetical protein
MKRFLRNIIVGILLGPLIVLVHLAALFIGRQRAIKLAGPALTRIAKRSLRYWVPQIERPEEFDTFGGRMRARFRLWKPLYDIAVTEETRDVFRIRVANCPFCEVLNGAGLRELSPYLCEGDWALARENADKWDFDRAHQLGPGDGFCNHTYLRKRG